MEMTVLPDAHRVVAGVFVFVLKTTPIVEEVEARREERGAEGVRVEERAMTPGIQLLSLEGRRMAVPVPVGQATTTAGRQSICICFFLDLCLCLFPGPSPFLPSPCPPPVRGRVPGLVLVLASPSPALWHDRVLSPILSRQLFPSPSPQPPHSR